MTSQAAIFACFDDSWPCVEEQGFEKVDGWMRLGVIPGGADVERPFWEAVRLQQVGGSRSQWLSRIEFYANVAVDSDAYDQVSGSDPSAARPFWLGLHPFASTTKLYVSSTVVHRVSPRRNLDRPPGLLVAPRSTPLAFELRLAETGSYFDVAHG